MNLFEINDAITRCVKLNDETLVDTETGEVIDTEALQALEMERDTKIENIGLWYKNLMSDAKQLDEQAKAFTARKKAAQNKAEQLKKYLDSFLDGGKFKSTRLAISYRKTASVAIDDIAQLPSDMVKIADPVPDKTAIKNAIKAGRTVAGAHIDERQSIQIK